VADERYARDPGAFAAQSPEHHVTTEPVPVDVNVADGAPVPVLVAFVAGVAASCAPDQRSTTIECQRADPVNACVTVTVPGEPDTVAVWMRTSQWFGVASAARWVHVNPPPLGTLMVRTSSSVTVFTTSTSPSTTVIAVVTRDVVLLAVELTC
jgi:hypothetical protein